MTMTAEERIQSLERKVEELSGELGMLKDIHSVRTLHFKYGYYMDKCLFGEIVDLFSDNCEIYFMGGLFRGKAGARRLYGGTTGLNGPVHGMLFEHLLGQDIVDVAADRMTAQGRFRTFMQGGVHASKTDAPPNIPAQFWEAGVYENIYTKEDGIWKFKVFNYNVSWQALYEHGWAHTPAGGTLMVKPYTKTYPADPKGPDQLTVPPRLWPDNTIVPFHYPNPVTGKWLKTPHEVK